ncbi:hypothetical protein NKR23_g6555 [Pleurostoma richardsiae]|uniref:Uncharacterized protein n=1 Tax=Pleurostoma richardsiae TaxID=41990 RepID=A0AA38VE32_9PEZI|nr:hypothetical protein NKR23_g6555 [Pleurostoma richardsiae]
MKSSPPEHLPRDGRSNDRDPQIFADVDTPAGSGVLCKLGSGICQLWEVVRLAHLITESNIKAYVLPVVLFSMLSVASGRMTTNSHLGWKDLARAFPRAGLYIWLYVLHFDLSNQKDAESIKEDKLNKPWRAIPSGRLSVKGAERWYVVATCLLLLASGVWLGGFPETLAFMVETWIYDYASGASSWWGKNLINALFYMTDLRDQEGDKARGRHTMPLAMGDGTARWVTALFVSIWSVVCPAYWADGRLTASFVLPVLIGTIVTARVLLYRSVKADRSTFHYYTLLWLPSLYLVPLLSKYDLL